MTEIITNIEKLREPAEPLKFILDTGLSTEEGTEIISKLKETMEEDKNIISLSAPQIGINKRIFCIRFNDTIKTFINPIITKKEGSIIAPETCFCFPGKEFLIARPKEITVVYYNDEFKYEDNKLLGVAARIFDQAAQMLDGILPDDLGLISTPETDGSLFELSDEEIAEYAELYKKFVAAKVTGLEKEITSDEDIAKKYQELKFTENVINGRVQVIDNSEAPKLNRAQRRAAEKANNKAQLKHFLGRKK